MLKTCLAPHVNAQTQLLILGSLPGDASLQAKQYYAHPQNRFWHLLSDVCCQDLVSLEYPARLQALHFQGIGLWDVVAQARRQGSLDSQIRAAQGNDLLGLIETLPALQAIAFNGATAAKRGLSQLGGRANHSHILALPSSSAAHTLSYSKKREAWLVLKSFLQQASD